MDLALMIGDPQCTRLFLSFSPPPSTLVVRGYSLTAFVCGLSDASFGKLVSCAPEDDETAHFDPQLPKRALPMLDIRTPDSCSILTEDESAIPAQSHFEFGEIADVLQALLGHGCDLEAINGSWVPKEKKRNNPRRSVARQETALHKACLIANSGLISFLVRNGAVVNRQDDLGKTPLHGACSRYGTSGETIRELLQHGADPNALDCYGRPPLIKACEYSSVEVIRCLVANGALVKAYGEENYHPLHAACKRPKWHPTVNEDTLEVIDYLVKLSGPGILSVKRRANGGLPMTPLLLATGAENWDAVEHLLKLGATVEDSWRLSRDLWDFAADARGRPFRLLLELGASPAGKCHSFPNKSIIAHYLDDCLQWEKKEGFEDNLEALVQAGADINARSYFSPPDMWEVWEDVTVLHVARGKGLDDEFIRILLRYGATEGEEKEDELKLSDQDPKAHSWEDFERARK
jgi:ankyrin repeat protein